MNRQRGLRCIRTRMIVALGGREFSVPKEFVLQGYVYDYSVARLRTNEKSLKGLLSNKTTLNESKEFSYSYKKCGRVTLDRIFL